MAMDYLPIQASAVPSERVFSSSAETDTKKRNRIHPVLMEALQMYKFALKKDRLDFMKGWVTSESLMVDVGAEDDSDLLASLLSDHEDTLDKIIAAVGAEEEEEEIPV
jgi:hypothetical protein